MIKHFKENRKTINPRFTFFSALFATAIVPLSRFPLIFPSTLAFAPFLAALKVKFKVLATQGINYLLLLVSKSDRSLADVCRCSFRLAFFLAFLRSLWLNRTIK